MKSSEGNGGCRSPASESGVGICDGDSPDESEGGSRSEINDTEDCSEADRSGDGDQQRCLEVETVGAVI